MRILTPPPKDILFLTRLRCHITTEDFCTVSKNWQRRCSTEKTSGTNPYHLRGHGWGPPQDLLRTSSGPPGSHRCLIRDHVLGGRQVKVINLWGLLKKCLFKITRPSKWVNWPTETGGATLIRAGYSRRRRRRRSSSSSAPLKGTKFEQLKFSLNHKASSAELRSAGELCFVPKHRPLHTWF